MPEAIIFDDTVQAKIIPVDWENVYLSIQKAKEGQFKEYGKLHFDDYDKRMVALKEGVSQQMLEDERIAREIVRAILSFHNSSCPPCLRGRDSVYTSRDIVFTDISQKDIDDKTNALYDAGLLAFALGFHPNHYEHWCFESEIVFKERIGDGFKIEYETNKELRRAITTMLKPFETEKALYVTEI